MRRALLPFLCAAAVAALAGPALAATNANRLVGKCAKSQVKPTLIILFCADDNEYVGVIKWSAFGGSQARGSGVLAINDCKPNCAAGKFADYTVSLTAADPKGCPDHHNDYRALTLRFPVLPAGSKLRSPQKFTLYCPIP